MQIETKRLIIKELTLNDIQRFSEYRNKQEVKEYQSWKKYTYKQAERRINYCLNHPFKPKLGNYQLGIYLNDLLIGDLFVEIDGYSTFTLGYTLDSLYWSEGYASEAVEAFLDYMKEECQFKVCLAHVYEENERSVRLLKRLGFVMVNKSWFYQDVMYKKNLF